MTHTYENTYDDDKQYITIPTKCPCCDASLIMNGENLQCPNTMGCSAQRAGRIKNWVSGLNLLEVGDKLIDKLVETGLVSSVSDLYQLTVDDLAGLERMGQKSAANVYASLWGTTEVPLDTFLGSLSIPLVAKSSIRMVMDAGYDTLDKIMGMGYDDLWGVKGLGERKSANLFNGLKKNAGMIEQLLKVGIRVKIMDENGKLNGKLNGMVITITGKTNIKRDDLAAIIEVNGGKYAKSVGKSSTHLVAAAEDSTSSKANKARAAGVQIISEDELIEMIEG